MSSFLSDWSTTTARSASSSAALAGRLQSWRTHSTLRYKSFSHKHRIVRIYNSALWTEGTFSSETRDMGPRRSALPRERSAIFYENEVDHLKKPPPQVLNSYRNFFAQTPPDCVWAKRQMQIHFALTVAAWPLGALKRTYKEQLHAKTHPRSHRTLIVLLLLKQGVIITVLWTRSPTFYYPLTEV